MAGLHRQTGGGDRGDQPHNQQQPQNSLPSGHRNTSFKRPPMRSHNYFTPELLGTLEGFRRFVNPLSFSRFQRNRRRCRNERKRHGDGRARGIQALAGHAVEHRPAAEVSVQPTFPECLPVDRVAVAAAGVVAARMKAAVVTARTTADRGVRIRDVTLSRTSQQRDATRFGPGRHCRCEK